MSDVPRRRQERLESAGTLLERARLRARLAIHRRRINRSRTLVAEALMRGPAYVAVSGGKDSTAMLGLVNSVSPTPGVFIDSGVEPPDAREVLVELGRRGFEIRTVWPIVNFVDMIRLAGWWEYESPLPVHLRPEWPKRAFRHWLVEEPARRLQRSGFAVAFVGLRAEESVDRRLNRRFHGHLHQRTDGGWSCWPIADWEALDSIAYCITHELPIARCYLESTAQDLNRIRTGPVLNTATVPLGSWQTLRRRYPEMWAELSNLFPRMRRWS